MQGAITHLIAGVPVSELGAAIDWYTRLLFGRPPDARAGEEILWDIDEHARLFIEPDARGAQAGSPSPSPVSTRSWSAWPPKASSPNRSRPTRTVSAT